MFSVLAWVAVASLCLVLAGFLCWSVCDAVGGLWRAFVAMPRNPRRVLLSAVALLSVALLLFGAWPVAAALVVVGFVAVGLFAFVLPTIAAVRNARRDWAAFVVSSRRRVGAVVAFIRTL